MDRVRKVTGQAAEQVVGYLSRYSAVAAATNIAEQAQLAMNAVTKHYAELLGPIEEKLEKIRAAQDRLNNQQELRRQERIVNNRYASEAKKAQAQLKIDEIRAQQAVSDRDAIINAEKKKLDAANETARLAQAELDLFQKRLDAQTSQYELLKQIDQIENRRDASANARVKKAKKELTPLEKQLKLIKLQQQELADMVEAYRARRTLADEEATAAQKLAATMKLQEISLNQQNREVEALELGYSGVFDEIRKIQVVLADIEKPKKKKGTLDSLASDLGGASKDKIKQAFDEYQKGLDDFQKRWEKTKQTFNDTVKTIDASLPPWLRLTDATGKMSPLLDTLTKAFAGVTAILVGGKLISTFKALTPIFAALGGAGSIAVAAIALVATAWMQNWFDIQGVTAKAVDDVMKKLDELAKSDTIFGVIIRGLQQFGKDLATLWSNLALYSLDPNIFWESLQRTQDNLQKFFAEVADKIREALPKIREALLKLFPDLGPALDKLTAAFKIDTSSFDKALDSIGKSLDNLGPKFSAAVILITSAIAGMRTAFANIVPIMATFAGLFKTAFSAILSGSWQAAVNGAALAARGLGAALVGAFKVLATPTTGKAFLSLGKALVASIGALGGLLRTALAQTLADVFSNIGGGNLLNPKTFIGSIISGRFKQGLVAGFKTLFDFLPSLVGDALRTFDRNLSNFILRINGWRGLMIEALKAPLNAFRLLATVGGSAFSLLAKFMANLGGAAITKFSTPLVKAFGLIEQAITRVTPAASRVFAMLLQLGDSLTRAGAFALRFATDFRGAMAGLKVGNIFSAIVKGATSAVKVLGSLGATLRGAFSLQGVLAPIQSIVKLFGSLGAVIAKGVGGGGGAISSILSTFAKGFGGLRTIITGIGPAIKGLLAPTNIIGFTIGFIVDQIVKNWGAISGFFGDLGGFLSELGGLFNPALLGNFMSALEGLFSGTEEGKKKFQAFFDSVFSYLQNWTGRIGNWFTTKVLPAFVGWVLNLPYEIGGYIVETFNAIVDLISKGADLIRVHVFPLIGAFTSWVVEAWPTISGYLGQLWNDFAGWIITTAGEIGNLFVTQWLPGFTAWLVQVWPGFYAGLSSLVVNIAGWIISTASSLLNMFVTQWVPAFVSWIIDVWPGFYAGLVDLVSLFGGWISTTATWLGAKFMEEWGPGMWQWIVETIPPLLGQLAAWTGQLLMWLATQGLPLLLVKMLEFATALVDWVGQAIAFIVPRLGEFIGTILSWIVTDGIPMLVGAVVGLAAALYGWISGSSEVGAGDSAWGKVGEAFQKFIGKIGEVITQDVLPALVEGAANMVTTFIEGVMQIFSAENIQAFVDAALGLGSSIMGGIGQGIQGGIEQLNNDFNNGLDSVFGGVKGFLGIQSPSKKAADEIGAPIAEGINEGVSSIPLDALAKAVADQLIVALSEVQTNTERTMSETAASTLPIAQQFAVDMQTLFTTMATTISNQLWLWSQNTQALYIELGANVETTLNTTAVNQMVIWTLIHKTATSWAVALKDAVVATFKEMSSAIEKIIGEIPDIVWRYLGDGDDGVLKLLYEDFVPEGVEIGAEFAAGIAFGIEDEIPGIVSVVEDMIDSALSAARSAMDAQSPSRETASQIGAPFVQGIAVGIAGEENSLFDQIAAMIASTMDVNAFNTGASIGQKIIAGLRDSVSVIADVANQLVSDVLASKAFSVGQTIGQQIAAGIASSTSAISGAVSSAVSGSMALPSNTAMANLSSAPAMSGVGTVNNYYNSRNYNLTLNTSRDVSSLRNEFTAMEVLAL